VTEFKHEYMARARRDIMQGKGGIKCAQYASVNKGLAYCTF